MEHSQHSKMSMLIAIVAAALVLVFLFILFFTGIASGNSVGITLPDPNSAPVDPQTPVETESGNFVVVTAENVLHVLPTIYRADAYHQVYKVNTGVDEFMSERTVELWVSGSLLQAEVQGTGETKSVLTDGSTVYLWYEEETPAALQPDSDISTEDILGLLTYEHLTSLDPASITDASYLVLEGQVPCIFVSSREYGDLECRYWISLETGLLYRAEILNQGDLAYTMAELSSQILTEEDSVFERRFLLPDGSHPFHS